MSLRITKTLLLALCLGLSQGCRTTNPKAYPTAGNQTIAAALKPIAEKHKVPALAGAVVTDAGEVWIAVVGIRSARGDEPATVDDLWHLGSCGKALTATLAARLVEQGKLNWNTTVAEVFPELAPSFKSELGKVTLIQLLSHRAGLPRDSNYRTYRRLAEWGSGTDQRRQLVKEAGTWRLSHPPGSNYLYSGYGYVIVGAMVERVTGLTFEQAMCKNVFEPMGMTSVVFESPDLIGASRVPWSHSSSGRMASATKIASTGPEVLRPAGCMRCSMEDWAKFVSHHLRGEQGRSDYLSAETYRRLHTPPFGGDYGLGWAVYRGDWAGGRFVAHNGSNRLNFAQILIAVKKGLAVLVCTNQDCSKATDDAIEALLKMYSTGRLAAKP